MQFILNRNCEISKDAEQIIKGLLQLNPEKRLTATQVREKLKVIIDGNSGIYNVDRIVPEYLLTSNNNDDDSVPNSIPDCAPVFKEKWEMVSSQNY